MDSTPGVGSCFTFRAPFGRTDQAERRLSGSVVVVGEPAHDGELSRARRSLGRGGGGRVAAGPRESRSWRAADGHRRSCSLIRGSGHSIWRRCENCIAAAETDPPNVVLVTSREQSDDASYLAVLPSEVDDACLFAALHAALAQPDVPVPMSWHDAASRRPALSVLVAEDNRINQQVIERMLRSAGHTVTLVGDGEQALDALETG